jgi:putative transposase
VRCSRSGAGQFLWKEAVHQQKTGWRPTLCGLSKLLTGARSSFAWLREGRRSRAADVADLLCVAELLVQGQGSSATQAHGPQDLPFAGAHHLRVLDPQPAVAPARRCEHSVVWSERLPSVPTSVRVYQDSRAWRNTTRCGFECENFLV